MTIREFFEIGDRASAELKELGFTLLYTVDIFCSDVNDKLISRDVHNYREFEEIYNSSTEGKIEKEYLEHFLNNEQSKPKQDYVDVVVWRHRNEDQRLFCVYIKLRIWNGA